MLSKEHGGKRNLRESIKALVVECGDCGEKQLWSEETTWRPCNSCGSMVVLKTISQIDLDGARESMPKVLAEMGKPAPVKPCVAYSDYTTYVLSIEDIERLKQLSRQIARDKKEAKTQANKGKCTARFARKKRGR